MKRQKKIAKIKRRQVPDEIKRKQEQKNFTPNERKYEKYKLRKKPNGCKMNLSRKELLSAKCIKRQA